MYKFSCLFLLLFFCLWFKAVCAASQGMCVLFCSSQWVSAFRASLCPLLSKVKGNPYHGCPGSRRSHFEELCHRIQQWAVAAGGVCLTSDTCHCDYLHVNLGVLGLQTFRRFLQQEKSMERDGSQEMLRFRSCHYAICVALTPSVGTLPLSLSHLFTGSSSFSSRYSAKSKAKEEEFSIPPVPVTVSLSSLLLGQQPENSSSFFHSQNHQLSFSAGGCPFVWLHSWYLVPFWN